MFFSECLRAKEQQGDIMWYNQCRAEPRIGLYTGMWLVLTSLPESCNLSLAGKASGNRVDVNLSYVDVVIKIAPLQSQRWLLKPEEYNS